MTASLTSFVSDYIARLPELPSNTSQWSCTRRAAVFLFADISGFSRLAHRLAPLGSEGAEELNRLLNAYFERLIDEIYEWGGDVVRFAGDAVLAVWDAGNGAPDETLEAISHAKTMHGSVELARQARYAAACGLAIQAKLHDYEVDAGVRLSVRVSLGAGMGQAALLGGVNDSWQVVFFGEPLEQVRRGDALAVVGDVVASPQVVAALGASVEGEPLADGFLRLQAADAPPPPAALDPPIWRTELRRFVAQPVLARADAGQIEWMADLRRVSVIFVNIPGVESADQPQRLLHECLVVLQQAMAKHGGTVVQLVCDDKGTVGVLCVGLPPIRHANGAERAISAAAHIERELAHRGLAARIGVSTGEVFCGPLGSRRRREYAILGDVVNLAARLMQSSSQGVLFDSATAKALPTDMLADPLPAHRLKGFEELIEVFRLRAAGQTPPLMGREHEMRCLQSFFTNDAARLLTIVGAAGLGKTELASRVMQQFQGSLRTCQASAHEIEARTPLYVWRDLLLGGLQIRRQRDVESMHHELLARCSAVQRQDRISLLNLFMGTTYPRQPFVEQLDSEHIHACLFELIELLLSRAQRCLYCVDNAHWMDEASWSLIVRLITNLPDCKFLLLQRPWRDAPPPPCAELSRRRDAECIELRPLNRADLLCLVRHRLGVAQLDPKVEGHVWDNSQGNPYFAAEMAEYLRDERLVVMDHGRCELAAHLVEQGLVALPPSLRELTASRIDRLEAAEQLTVKSASVLGIVFEDDGVQAVFPVREQASQVPHWLDDLSQEGLLRPFQEDFPPRHAFTQQTVQRVAYHQLPLAQRRQLHTRAAQWIDRNDDSTPGKNARLAYHWQQAGDDQMHMEAAARAGADAFHAGSYRDAVAFLEQAMELHEALYGDAPIDEQRRWRAGFLRLLAEAWFSLGDLTLSSSLLYRSLQLANRRDRATPWSVKLDSLWLMLVQGWRLWRSRPAREPLVVAEAGQSTNNGRSWPRSRHADRADYDRVLTHERLAQICYFNNNVVFGVNHALRALHQAESLPPSPALARCYANMSIAMQVIGIDWMCRRYVERALQVARQVNQPGALVYVLNVTNVVQLGRGHWEQVLGFAEEALAVARRINDPHAASESLTVMAMLDCLRGDYHGGATSFRALLENADRSDNELHRVWAWNGLGEVALRQGDLPEAIELLQRAAHHLPAHVSPTEEIRVWGLKALAQLRSGEEAAARASWRQGQTTLSTCHSLTMSSLEGVSGLVSAACYFLAKSPRSKPAQRDMTAAVQWISQLARRYRLARPRAHRFLARQAALGGKSAQAVRLCRAARDLARELGMPLDEALALHEHARITRDPRAMQDAQQRFQRLNATFEEAACDLDADALRLLLV